MVADTETGFREFEHSGDVGIEAWGATYAELIEQATRGLFGLMVWNADGGESAPRVALTRGPRERSRGVGKRQDPRPSERRLEVHASSPADVLVDWLNEVITAAATRGEVYDDVAVQSADETSASGTIRGEPFDAARHERRFDVKAATYHGLVCEKTGDGFHARIIFDL